MNRCNNFICRLCLYMVALCESLTTYSVMSDLITKRSNMQTDSLELPLELKEVDGDEGVFVGYGSRYGVPDLAGHVVAEGCFAKSIAQKGAEGVSLLYQHDPYRPIGIFTEIKENKQGLRVKCKLALGTQDGKEAYELIKMGAIKGMSIGFRSLDDEYISAGTKNPYGKKTRRIIKEADLVEISIVTFPQNPKAQITNVKSEAKDWVSILEQKGLPRHMAEIGAQGLIDAITDSLPVSAERKAMNQINEIIEDMKR